MSTVRRTPCRSMPMPMNSCMAPKAKWKAPANRPSAWALRPNSSCSGAAIKAATLRQDWLSAKAEAKASSMIQAERREAGAEGVLAAGAEFMAASVHDGLRRRGAARSGRRLQAQWGRPRGGAWNRRATEAEGSGAVCRLAAWARQ